MAESAEQPLVKLNGQYAEHQTKIETNIRSKFNDIREALDARERDVMAELENHTQQQLKSCFAYSTQIVETCQDSVHICTSKEVTNYCALKVVPSRRMKTTQPLPVAILNAIDSKQRIVGLDLLNIEAKIVSKLTNETTKCVVKERGKGEFEISYQPTVGGASELIVSVGGEEVAGSPFPVAVKTPIDKLGTVIKTINDLKKPRGVALNQAGEIIVTEEDAGIVSIFSPTEEKLRTLDTRGTAVGEMKNPRCVAVDGDDNVLVVDNGNHRLLKFSRVGDLIAAVGSDGDGPGQLNNPCGMCVNSVNGKVYVVNYGADCVHIFNSDLTFSSKFGSYGSGNGQLNNSWDVASDRSGCVYVADASNHRVQVFTPDGGYLKQFGQRGSGNGELYGPVSIYVDNDDLVYVGELGNGRVSMFTCEGVYLKSFGSHGSGPGQFNSPYGIAVDHCGVVYVCDFSNKRVQIVS